MSACKNPLVPPKRFIRGNCPYGDPETHGDARRRTNEHKTFTMVKEKKLCAGVGAKCPVITKFVHPKKTYKLCWIILAEYQC
jgi:hypothetical protein